MGLFDDDGGKTEKPTPTRLADVRNKGDTPLSHELVQGGVLLIAALLFRWCGGWLVDALGGLMRHGLVVDKARRVDEVPYAAHEMLSAIGSVAAPFAVILLTLVGSTLLLGYGQIGVHFATDVLGFRLERINPFTNFGRLLNLRSIVRTAFALVKLAVLLGVLWFVLGDRWQVLFTLHELEFPTAVAHVASLALTIVLWVGLVVFSLSAADLFWQRYQFEKRHMMTKQEIEDERKRSEGDPTMKARQKKARNELMRHRMMQAVPKADVVVTNPTHFSVALRYDRKRDPAPIVVAKGVDEVAMIIRELAKEHGVPLMEDPPLARALYRAVKIGQSVPEKFYHAVAAVLSHVYRMKGKTA